MFIKKRVLPGLILSVVFSVSLYATSVRDMGMGLYEYPWFSDGLQSYIYQNPAYLSNYNNFTFFERVGALDGQNMGALFYSLTPSVNIGIHIGRPVDSKIWTSTDSESLFHRGNYEIKGAPVAGSVGGVGIYCPTGVAQYDGYQFSMLDGSIIDLMDPTQGSRYLDATSTSKSDNVNELLQRNVSLMLSFKSGDFAMGMDLGYATSWTNKRNSNETGNDEYIFINTEYDAMLGILYNIDTTKSFDISVGGTMYSVNYTYDRMIITNPDLGVGPYTVAMSYKTKLAIDANALLRYNMVLARNHKMHIRTAYTYINHSTTGKMKIENANRTDTTAVDYYDYNIAGDDNFIRTGQTVKFGISDEMNFSTIKAFAGFDIQYKMFKNDYSGEDKDTLANSADKYINNLNSITIPVIIGMEAYHNENWTSRYGIVQKIYQPITNTGKNITDQGSSENPSDYNGNSSSTTDLFAGVTYRRDNFSFDWLLNMNLFVAGPYLVSGKTATGSSIPLAFSTAIAATYSYDSLISGKSNLTETEAKKFVNEVKPVDVKNKK